MPHLVVAESFSSSCDSSNYSSRHMRRFPGIWLIVMTMGSLSRLHQHCSHDRSISPRPWRAKPLSLRDNLLWMSWSDAYVGPTWSRTCDQGSNRGKQLHRLPELWRRREGDSIRNFQATVADFMANEERKLHTEHVVAAVRCKLEEPTPENDLEWCRSLRIGSYPLTTACCRQCNRQTLVVVVVVVMVVAVKRK